MNGQLLLPLWIHALRTCWWTDCESQSVIGWRGRPLKNHMASGLLLTISRSIRLKTQNVERFSHSRFDKDKKITFWRNKKWKNLSKIGKPATCHWSGKPNWMTNYQKCPDEDLKMVSYLRVVGEVIWTVRLIYSSETRKNKHFNWGTLSLPLVECHLNGEKSQARGLWGMTSVCGRSPNWV